MFDIGAGEMLMIAVVAILVIGPKDLPRALRTAGQWIGKVRGMARHFQTGLDTMIREAELEEMEQKWKAENERIMREHPPEPQMEPLAANSAPDSAGAAKAAGDKGKAAPPSARTQPGSGDEQPGSANNDAAAGTQLPLPVPAPETRETAAMSEPKAEPGKA